MYVYQLKKQSIIRIQELVTCLRLRPVCVCVCVCVCVWATGRHLSFPANNRHLFRFYTLIFFYKFSLLIPIVVLLIFYEYSCQRTRSHVFLQSKDFIDDSWRDKFWWGNKPKFDAWPIVLWCYVWLYYHETQIVF